MSFSTIYYQAVLEAFTKGKIPMPHSGQWANAGISNSQSLTLTCAHGQAPILAKTEATGFGIRRLTPLECERLQGYPDRWTEYGHDGAKISDSKRYQMLGNSVAVPCVVYIMQGIRQALLENKN